MKAFRSAASPASTPRARSWSVRVVSSIRLDGEPGRGGEWRPCMADRHDEAHSLRCRTGPYCSSGGQISIPCPHAATARRTQRVPESVNTWRIHLVVATGVQGLDEGLHKPDSLSRPLGRSARATWIRGAAAARALGSSGTRARMSLLPTARVVQRHAQASPPPPHIQSRGTEAGGRRTRDAIAERLDTPINAAKTRHYRGMAWLKSYLESREEQQKVMRKRSRRG